MATATLELLANEGESSFFRGNYRVQHLSKISQEVQEDIRRKSAGYLLKEGIASKEEIEKAMDEHDNLMDESKCILLENNPEHYWPIVFAYGLGDSHWQAFERAVDPFIKGPAYKRYLINQMAWACAAIDIYRWTHNGNDPDLNEENKLTEDSSPIFRALYVIWHGITGKELNYDWAVDILKRERAKKVDEHVTAIFS